MLQDFSPGSCRKAANTATGSHINIYEYPSARSGLLVSQDQWHFKTLSNLIHSLGQGAMAILASTLLLLMAEAILHLHTPIHM